MTIDVASSTLERETTGWSLDYSSSSIDEIKFQGLIGEQPGQQSDYGAIESGTGGPLCSSTPTRDTSRPRSHSRSVQPSKEAKQIAGGLTEIMKEQIRANKRMFRDAQQTRRFIDEVFERSGKLGRLPRNLNFNENARRAATSYQLHVHEPGRDDTMSSTSIDSAAIGTELTTTATTAETKLLKQSNSKTNTLSKSVPQMQLNISEKGGSSNQMDSGIYRTSLQPVSEETPPANRNVNRNCHLPHSSPHREKKHSSKGRFQRGATCDSEMCLIQRRPSVLEPCQGSFEDTMANGCSRELSCKHPLFKRLVLTSIGDEQASQMFITKINSAMSSRVPDMLVLRGTVEHQLDELGERLRRDLMMVQESARKTSMKERIVSEAVEKLVDEISLPREAVTELIHGNSSSGNPISTFIRPRVPFTLSSSDRFLFSEIMNSLLYAEKIEYFAYCSPNRATNSAIIDDLPGGMENYENEQQRQLLKCLDILRLTYNELFTDLKRNYPNKSAQKRGKFSVANLFRKPPSPQKRSKVGETPNATVNNQNPVESEANPSAQDENNNTVCRTKYPPSEYSPYPQSMPGEASTPRRGRMDTFAQYVWQVVTSPLQLLMCIIGFILGQGRCNWHGMSVALGTFLLAYSALSYAYEVVASRTNSYGSDNAGFSIHLPGIDFGRSNTATTYGISAWLTPPCLFDWFSS